MSFEHILVASNLSPGARQSYPHAAAFAKAFDAKVTLLHIDELGQGFHESGALSDYLDTVSHARSDRLEAHVADFQRYGVEPVIEVVPGLPKTAIDSFARERGADLVVMSKRNRSRFNELLMGSTTKRVLRIARVPILVVHIGDADAEELPEELPTYPHILCGTDLSEQARRGLRATLSLADTFESRVTLVHVLRLPTLQPIVAGEQPIGLPRGGLDELEAKMHAGLRKEVRAVGDERVWPMIVVGGNPGDSIVDAAESEGANLITIPTAGRTGLKEILLGSTAERVAKRSAVPVMVLPRPYLERFDP